LLRNSPLEVRTDRPAKQSPFQLPLLHPSRANFLQFSSPETPPSFELYIGMPKLLFSPKSFLQCLVRLPSNSYSAMSNPFPHIKTSPPLCFFLLSSPSKTRPNQFLFPVKINSYCPRSLNALHVIFRGFAPLFQESLTSCRENQLFILSLFLGFMVPTHFIFFSFDSDWACFIPFLKRLNSPPKSKNKMGPTIFPFSFFISSSSPKKCYGSFVIMSFFLSEEISIVCPPCDGVPLK